MAAAGAARESNPLMEPFQLLRHCYAFAKAAPHPPAPAGFSLASAAEPMSRVHLVMDRNFKSHVVQPRHVVRACSTCNRSLRGIGFPCIPSARHIRTYPPLYHGVCPGGCPSQCTAASLQSLAMPLRQCVHTCEVFSSFCCVRALTKFNHGWLRKRDRAISRRACSVQSIIASAVYFTTASCLSLQ